MQTLKSHPLSLRSLCDKDEMSSSISSKTVQCDTPYRAWPFPLRVHPGFSHAFELQQCSSEHYESVLKCSLSVLLKCVDYVKGLFCFPLSQLLAWFFTALPTHLVRLVLRGCRGDFRGETSMMALFASKPEQSAKYMHDSHVKALRHCIVWVLGFKSSSCCCLIHGVAVSNVGALDCSWVQTRTWLVFGHNCSQPLFQCTWTAVNYSMTKRQIKVQFGLKTSG